MISENENGAWRSGLTHRILIPAFEGSNPSAPAILFIAVLALVYSLSVAFHLNPI